MVHTEQVDSETIVDQATSVESTIVQNVGLRKGSCSSKTWPVCLHVACDSIPQGSRGDIGRLVLRKITDTGQQQQLSDVGKRSGWAAVGVVVDYVAMREVRVKNIAGIGGEIGDEMSALYRDSIRDSWQILFGNFDTEVYDVTKLIYGFNLYHKVKLSAELQKLYGIESAQMNSNCIPPGMRKVAVAGQLSSKSSKTQKLHSSPAHLEVSEECTRLSGSKGQNYDIFSSDDIISKGVSLNSVLLNNNAVKSSTSFRSGQSVDKHSTASVSTTSHITSSKPQCRICGSYQNSSSGLGSLDSELSTPTVENPFVTEDGNYFCGTCLKATLSLSLSGKTFCDLHSIHGAGERQMEERIDTGGSSQGDVLSSKRIRDEDASNTGDESKQKAPSKDRTICDYYSNLCGDADGRAVKKLKPPLRKKTPKGTDIVQDLTSETDAAPVTSNIAAATAREDDADRGSSGRSAICFRKMTAGSSMNMDVDVTHESKHCSGATEDQSSDDALTEGNKHPQRQSTEDKSSDGESSNRQGHWRRSLRTLTPSYLTERGMKRIVYEEIRSEWLSRVGPPVLSLVCLSNGRASREATAAMLKGLWGVSQRGECWEGANETEGGSGVFGLHDWLSVTFASDWLGSRGPEVPSPPFTAAYRENFGSSTGQQSTVGAAAACASHIPAADCRGSNILCQCPNVSAVDIEFQGEKQGSDSAISTRLFLRPFEGKRRSRSGHSAVTSADAGVDLYLNIGGPIWALALAPHHPVPAPSSPSSSKPQDSLSTSVSHQFLAVGTSRVGWEKCVGTGTYSVGDDAQYAVGGQALTANLLQIWRMDIGTGQDENHDSGKMMMNRAASGNPRRQDDKMDAAVLCYCVALTRGPVWKIAWSSWRPFIDPEKNKGEKEGTSLLGVLAVVCGDGSCLVLVLPRSIPPSNSTGPPSGPTVINEQLVCRWVLTVPAQVAEGDGSIGGSIRLGGNDLDLGSNEERVSILSAAWSPHHPLQLCCGLADGAIAIFDLETHLTTNSSSSSSSSSRDKHSPHHAQGLFERDWTSGDNTTIERGKLSQLEQPSLHQPSPPTVSPSYCLSEGPADRSKQKISSCAAVRSASFCPYHPNLLLSSGYSSDVKVWSTKNPSNPLHVRTFPVEHGWMYDSRWDPQGRGYFVGCSDNSAVCWDNLLDAAQNSREKERNTGASPTSSSSRGHSWHRDRDRHRTACPRLYGHEGRLEGVWGVEAFLCDGQTALASVSSDGTFRCAFASTLTGSHRRDFIDGRDLGSRVRDGDSDGDRDGRGRRQGSSVTVTASRSLDQWVLEAFRIHSVTTLQPATAHSNYRSTSTEREDRGWTGSVALVCVDRVQKLDVRSDIVTLNTPSVAIHAVDSIPLRLRDSTSHPTCRLMAYGGAAGVLRVHSLDMLQDIVL